MRGVLNYKVAAVVAILASYAVISYAAKPTLKLASDGFPSGQSTPEGVASDLARTFIRHDVSLFRQICIRPYGGGTARSEYIEFLEGTSDTLKEAGLRMPSPNNPRKITKVFAARRLTKNGPSSYGYAAFEFKDVMFVDVEVLLNDNAKYVKRTLVIQDRDGKWYAHPAPHISPLLSVGLEQESPSTQLFSAVYEVQR